MTGLIQVMRRLAGLLLALPAALACAWPMQPIERPPVAPDPCAQLPVAALCPGLGPAVLRAPPGTRVLLGEAVNLVDGSLQWREADLPALPGVLGLEIVRHYRSDAAGRAGAPAVEDALGQGWRLGYDTRWRRSPAGLEIDQADGTVLVFQRDALQARHWRAAQAECGEVVLHSTPRGDEPVWHWPDGRQLRFAAGGWLEQIVAPGGEFVSLQHDRDGRLLAVTDPQGRSLQLRYEAGHGGEHGMPVVRHIDSPVGRFSFDYQPAANGPVPLLVKASWPTQYDAGRRPHAFANRIESLSAAARLYHHEDPPHPARLTGVSHQAQHGDEQWTSRRLLRWVFDAQGRVSGMEATDRGRNGRWALRWSLSPDGAKLGVAVEGGWDGEALAERWTSRREAGAWRVVERAHGPAGEERRIWRYGTAGELAGERQQRGGRQRDIAATRDTLGRLRQLRLTTGTTLGERAAALRVQVVDLAFDGSGARPTRLAWASAVPGRRAGITLGYTAAGQPARLDMAGFTPGDLEPLRQGWRWRYAPLQGSSVLTGWSADASGNGPQAHAVEHDPQGRRVVAVARVPGGQGRWQLQADAVGRVAGWVDPQGVQTVVDLSPRGEWLGMRRAGLAVPIEPPAGPPVARHGPAIVGPADEMLAIAGRVACDLAATECDDFGRSVRDAEGSRAFDAAGRLAWSRQADGSEVRYRRDAMGRAVRLDRRSPRGETVVEHFLYAGTRRSAYARVAGGRIEAEGIGVDAAGRPMVQASLRPGLAVPMRRAWRYYPQGGMSHTYLPDGLAVLHAPSAEAGLPWPAVSLRHPDGSIEALALRRAQVWHCDEACDEPPLFDLDARGRVVAYRVRLDARHWFRLETAHAVPGPAEAGGAWSMVRPAGGWVRAGAWLKSWWQGPEETGAGGAVLPVAWRVAPWR